MENSAASRVRNLVAFALIAWGHAASAAVAPAQVPPRQGLFRGADLQFSSIDNAVSQVQAGGVLVVSEQHGNQLHYTNQKTALAALAKTGRCKVSVGLEFLSWKYQTSISDYFDGLLSEADFLTAVDWRGIPFSNYRDQARFPLSYGGRLIGLNAPKSLTSAIAKSGIAQLSPQDQADMPPAFELGTQAYRERFEMVMGTHIPPSAVDRYFEAQSTWDESMAWQSVEFLKNNPKHCLVIVVGDFHAAWDGGLPGRLRARGIPNVTVISQLETRDLTDAEISDELGPHPKYGVRADAIWLTQSPPDQPTAP